MKCDEFKNLFVDYLCGELSGKDYARAEAHLQSCPECRREVAAVAETLDIVRGTPSPEPSSTVVQSLLRAAAEQPLERSWRESVPRWVLRPAFGVALAAMLIVGVFITNQSFYRQPVVSEDNLGLDQMVKERSKAASTVSDVGAPAVAEQEALEQKTRARGARVQEPSGRSAGVDALPVYDVPESVGDRVTEDSEARSPEQHDPAEAQPAQAGADTWMALARASQQAPHPEAGPREISKTEAERISEKEPIVLGEASAKRAFRRADVIEQDMSSDEALSFGAPSSSAEGVALDAVSSPAVLGAPLAVSSPDIPDATTAYVQARARQIGGEHEEAVHLYDIVIRQDPRFSLEGDTSHALVRRAESLVVLKRYEEAIASYRQAQEVFPEEEDALELLIGHVKDVSDEWQR